MSYTLDIKEEALEELSDAYHFYEKKREGLGEDFSEVIEEHFIRIKKAPQHHPTRYKNKRITVVRKYPFMIVFEIEESTFIVYAIFHTSRNHKSWKKR